MRDIINRIEEGKTILQEHERSDLTRSEIEALRDSFYKNYKDESLDLALFQTISDAFVFGVSVGSRCNK